MFENIPAELKAIPSWLVWSYEDVGSTKPTKIPYSAKTGKLASVTDPTTWSTFKEAVEASHKYSGIGFVFSDNDEYSFIDLDDTKGDVVAQKRQLDVYHEFNSYSEISPSGLGLHIIVKGKVPAGRRRSNIEVYSSSRYATFTGNVYPPNDPKPIAERQELLMQLWNQMGGGPATHIYSGDDVQKYQDTDILTQAINAVNGQKFKNLLDGIWTNDYPSQSEADLAFVDIVAFYTQNKAQIKRIFRNSKLGSRLKAQREDYVEYMIAKSFDNMLPPIDFDGFNNQLELKLAEPKVAALTTEAMPNIMLPQGLLGEIAQFIYAAAPRPVPEIALAASIGLMAGIVGRAYNISGTGLNQYVLLLADTGTGKEAMASGIDRLMNAIRLQVPTSSTYIGPSEIASGQALIKHLNKVSQCFVSILGEFGLRLQQMSSMYASSSEVGLRRMLLDLYNKSGYGQVSRPIVYSDRDKNIEVTNSPSFTILGESTPERFYGALNEEMISEGLLPRFMIIEYKGPRPELNKNAYLATPSFSLIEKFASLVANCESITHNKSVINVLTNPDAQKVLDDFDAYTTSLINKTDKDVLKQLWNRAHMKALKIAALLAVGTNMIMPKIELSFVEYAIEMVQNDITTLTAKFEQGLIGSNTNEMKQVAETIRMIREFLGKDAEQLKLYLQGKQDKNLHQHKIIPYSYLNKRLAAVACFRNDRVGSTVALKRSIQTLIDSDKLREIGKAELAAKYRTTQRAFVVSNPDII